MDSVPDRRLGLGLSGTHEVGPSLHHRLAFFDVFSSVVRRGDLALFNVRQLSINDAQLNSKLFLDVGHGKGPETVGSHPSIEPHSLQRHVEGVVAEHPAFRADTLEHTAFIAVDGFKGLEMVSRLLRKRDQVLFPVAPLAFHALGRNSPHGILEINLFPSGAN